MNWWMGRSELGHRWNLLHSKSEQPDLVPQGRNWTKTKRKKVVDETTGGEERGGERGGKSLFSR